MIGATLIGVGTDPMTDSALFYILPGILAVLLSLVGIIGTLGKWYRMHTWVSCYNYPLVLESFKDESLQIPPSIDHCLVVVLTSISP